MESFFNFISKNPLAFIVLIASVVVVVFSAVLIYLVAFFQGRKISFWPPNVGQRPDKGESGEKEEGESNHEMLVYKEHKHTHNVVKRGNSLDLSREMRLFMIEQTGIERVYDNLLDSIADLRKDFERAKQIKLLLQIGRRELGDGKSSIFYNLARQKNQPGEKIFLLRASEYSPFLSKKRAERRGRTSYREWQSDLQRLCGIVERLRNEYGAHIVVRTHSEPFLWRLFIFDDVAYVSAYIKGYGNDQVAPVYRIVKGPKSQFIIFNKYFDYLWRKYDSLDTDVEEKWADWQ